MLDAKADISSTFGNGLFSAPASPDRSRASRWLQEQLKRSRREGVFTISAELTPELAELLLQANSDNRSISQAKLRDYVRDVKAGDWQHNGEPVIVADTGELNDGQHRCGAVIEAGRSITTQMTFGVERETRRTIDIGLKRTIGSILTMTGHPDGNRLAHAATLIMIFDRHQAISRNPEHRPTNIEIQDWCALHPELKDQLFWGRRVRHALGGSVGLFAALYHLMARKSEADADNFFGSLIDGEGLRRGSPIYLLREMLIKERGSKRKLPDADIAALAIKSWNLFRNNKSRRVLVWRTTGPDAESFPIPE